MARVKIPFRPRFKAPMLHDVKVMTCRTKRMGDAGDTFDAFGATFRLTHVFRTRLGFIIADCFIQEGCDSVHDLIEVWKSIHPSKGVDRDAIVYAHCFRRIA